MIAPVVGKKQRLLLETETALGLAVERLKALYTRYNISSKPVRIQLNYPKAHL